jgi:hypothetical protein
MASYSGRIDDSDYYSKAPFVVLSWPARNTLGSYSSAEEAMKFIGDTCKDADSRSRVRLYGFVNGEWKLLFSL